MDLQSYNKISYRRRKKKIIMYSLEILVLLGVIIAAISVIRGDKGHKLSTKLPKSISQTKTNKTKPDQTIPKLGDDTLEFTFTGDLLLGKDKNADMYNTMPAKMEEVGGDYTYFLRNFKELFDADDATIVDFEGTLTESNDYVDKEFNFKAPPDYVNILTNSSIEAVTLANNHSHDYGEQGFIDTTNTIESNGILTAGYDKIAYLEIKKRKVALIGAYLLNEGNTNDENMALNNIDIAKQNGVDLVIVFAHWGIEKEYVPDSFQVQMGHQMIDKGADLVVGCHPHVIQGYEEYNGHYIVYSMGNFCFGGNRNPSDKDCYVVRWKANMKDKTLNNSQIEVIPTSVSSSLDVNDYQPRILDGDEKTRVMTKINDSNQAIIAN